MSHTQWNTKQLQFFEAIQRYESMAIYMRITQFVSWSNVVLQISLLILALQQDLGVWWQLLAGALAFVLADFVNGLVHLFMDHNTHYTSAVGPLIAAFHLHHDTPRYRDKTVWCVYVEESGSKIWLLIFSVLLLVLSVLHLIPFFWVCAGAYFVAFSMLAEISHYMCHNSHARLVRVLQHLWIFLPKKHHMLHHRLDNVNYAFLNGMTDPLINWIAKKYYGGYVSSTDQHLALYQQQRKQASPV